MRGKCKWEFKYKEYGKYKYATDCGYIAYWQRYSVFCPFCGREVVKIKEVEEK